MKKLTLLILVAVMALMWTPVLAQSDSVKAALEAYNQNLPEGYGTISAEDVGTALIERTPVLLDVREANEYAEGHIEGSFNVPIRELGKNLNLLPDLNAEIIVICKGGGRAMLAQSSLNVLGYVNAKTMKGGFSAWVGEEFPVSTEPFVPEAGTAPEFDADLLAAVDSYLSSLPEGYGLVGVTALAEELAEKELVLIDVRSEAEWNEQGYIAGAQHIWIDEFMAHQDMWPADKNTEIVIYCASSYRGGIAMTMLKLMGYANVRNVTGGFNAWVAEGLPFEGGMPAAEFDLPTYLTDYVAGLPENYNALRVTDLEAELAAGGDLFLLDVRSPDEYAEGHIEGAVNVPIETVADNLALLPALDANIVVYCGSGHRSAIIMEVLNLLGYTNVRSLLGGTKAWMTSELPVTDVPTTVEPGTMPAVNADVLPLVAEYLANLPAGYYTVKAEDLSAELAESPVVLIDLRTDGEYAEGFLEGALHIPFADFMTRLSEVPTTGPVVLYDNPTHRSTMAMVMLQLLGYTDIRVLAGGSGAWTSAGLPLVTE
ncbi:MAG: hypothetical protein K8L91_00150 [Anaerolineae bacterium]|nr:hypothetical protein [Anaerolineae bacterium]